MFTRGILACILSESTTPAGYGEFCETNQNLIRTLAKLHVEQLLDSIPVDEFFDKFMQGYREHGRKCNFENEGWVHEFKMEALDLFNYKAMELYSLSLREPNAMANLYLMYAPFLNA